MNERHSSEQRLADWLEDGPADAPDQILETILAAFPSIPQRRAVVRVPWRTSSMNGHVRALAGIAAVVAIAVGALILRPGSSSSGIGAGQSASRSPSSAPPSPEALATVPIGWTTYTSSRIAYSIDHPAEWIVTPATQDWPSTGLPDPTSPAYDVFLFRQEPIGTRLLVSSDPLEAGEDAAGRLAEMDRASAAHGCQSSDRHTITIDGVSARQEDQVCVDHGTDYLIEVLITNNSRFYKIILFSNAAFTDEDRATVDRVLASFRFGG